MKNRQDVFSEELVELLKQEVNGQRQTISDLEQELGGMKMLEEARLQRNRRLVFWISIVISIVSLGISVWF